MKVAQIAIGHAVASAVVVFGAFLCAIVAYFGLLAWAILLNQPLGGPLALPFMALAALVGSCVAVLVVLFPSTLLGSMICRALRWSKLAEIPLATLMSILITLSVGAVAGLAYGTPQQGIRFALVTELALLVPLGLYWWSLQGTTWLVGFGQRMRRWAWRSMFPKVEGAG